MNNSGQSTLDFLYASVLILGTATLIGVLTSALTLIEVAQYVSFSGARSYFAADKNISNQVQAADAQVASLQKTLPFLSAAISNEWIKLQLNGAKDYTQYAQSKGAAVDFRNEFNGYQMEVALPLLKIKIPLLGNMMNSSSDDDDVKVIVASYLMREPTFDECTQFNSQVLQALISRNGNYAKAKGATFVAINDNGC